MIQSHTILYRLQYDIIPPGSQLLSWNYLTNKALNSGHSCILHLRLVFTSDGSRSRREPYTLMKTARQKQKKKETFPFSSAYASASIATENQPLLVDCVA